MGGKQTMHTKYRPIERAAPVHDFQNSELHILHVGALKQPAACSGRLR